MTKINPNFAHDIFTFLHKPLRDLDKSDGDDFLDRFLLGPQSLFEDTQAKIATLRDLMDPTKTRPDLLQFLKDHVGFTKDLNKITDELVENDLRKLIILAVPLWKTKGTEAGYTNILRLFTGKSARVFNWFDFRMIIGEVAFGEEQLGQDPFLISVPGVEASSDTLNNVILLLTFEGNVLDRTINGNNGTIHGTTNFFNTPPAGFPQGSDKYIRFTGGTVTVPSSGLYDFSGDFTVEGFFRTSTTTGTVGLVTKKETASGKGIRIELDTTANVIKFNIDDGTNNVGASLIAVANLDDGALRHFALTVNRTTGTCRLWLDGTEATAETALGIVGDVTNTEQWVVGGSAVGVGVFTGDMDNFRVGLKTIYDVTVGTLLVPITGFIEFIEEQLDEFQSDIRIVDEGSLNKTLILRILNLMRPVSERLNVIFIRFFDDFLDGVGQFSTISGTVAVNTEQQMQLENSSEVRTSVLGDDDFTDIVLQVKANDTLVTGGVFSILFFVQDNLNFYEYRINTATGTVSLHKTVAGVPSQIGADIFEDVVPQVNYVFTVTTSFNSLTNDTLIRTLVDRNTQHEIIDASFTKGKFGLKTDGATVMQVTTIEMMTLPVDVRRINPGFNL